MENRLSISISQHSDKGCKVLNQDFYDARIPSEPLLSLKGIAIALADGISSSQVSQEASKTSVTTFLTDYFSTPDTWSVETSARRIITASNAWLNAQSRQAHLHLDKDRGYVCTFSALILRSTTAHIFHIGDTRIYRLREGKLTCLTKDHRLWISKEKSYLSRALGMDSELNLEYSSSELHEGDIFILMTDGVYEFVPESIILETLDTFSENYEQSAQALIRYALQNDSDDNLTCQVVRVDSLPKQNRNELYQSMRQKPCPDLLEARQIFEGYSIVRELSATSRSHVYLAKDQETQEHVVLKIPSIDLRDDKEYLERFVMEEWIARRVTNPHVMKAYEQNRPRNYIYNVFEFVEGQTLAQWIIDNPKPSLEVVRDIADQIIRGLHAFHRKEMIHQDLRPNNILIDTTGTVKIIDFGATKIAGIADDNVLQQTGLMGTALYSAPEYFLGQEGSYKSDLFSLGAIVYEMLYNKLPYGVNVARCKTAKAQRSLHYMPQCNDENKIPLWVDEALRKALEINPIKRYGELSEFSYDLRHPNKAFLSKTKPPLLERNPLLFWQSSTFILLALSIFLLLFKA